MRIGLFGIGRVGRPTLDAALARGHEVTVLVRDPDRARLPREDPRLTVVRGDALDPQAVRRTIEGAGAVITALGPSGSPRPPDVLTRAMETIVAEMKEAGVPRLVTISMMGLGESRANAGVFGKVIVPLLRSKLADRERQEQVVRSSGLEWVLVRSVRISPGEATGAITAATDARAGLKSTIAVGDVAEFLVSQVDSRRFIAEAPSLVG